MSRTVDVDMGHGHGHAPARPAADRPRWLAGLDTFLGFLVEIPAAILVLTEIVVLLAGVISRYVFHSPIIWSDELASILFLWLAMLGAVVAFRRAEHMRMTAVVGMLSPPMRAFLDVVAVAAALAFLFMTIMPAIEFAEEEAFITTPALEIPNAWRAAALPVGIGLMIVIGLLKLIEVGNWRHVLGAVAVVGGIVGALVLMQPVLRGLGNYNLLIFFVGLVGLMVFAGVPIAFSFGLATFGYLALTTRTPLGVVIGRMDEGMSHLILLSVPLFVFLGLLIEMTGMARAMVGFLASLLGHVRGGLHYVLIGAMYLVSGISGSKAADMAAVAPVLFPEMKQRGAKPGDLVALLSATGAQTETIPPSLVLITIGSVTGVSIAALFTGGMLPGVVLGHHAGLPGVVALPQRGPVARQAGHHARGRLGLGHCLSGHCAALRHPLRGDRGHRDGDRGVHHRHRLLGPRRPADLPAVRLAPAEADADRDGGAVGGDPADHRRRHRHGLGADPVGLLPRPGQRHDGRCPAARRPSWRCRSSPSSSSAACWKASRPSCCSGRCCSPSPSRSACTRCIMRWW